MKLLEDLISDYDETKHKLSTESEEKVKELVKNISNTLRFDYDNFTKLLNDNEFKEYSKYYIGEGHAKDLKEMVSHVLNAKTLAFSNEVKTNFISLLNIE